MPTYQVLIDRDDDGDFAETGEDISGDVLALTWRLGMTSPYQHVAPPGFARITVRNRDRRYSPEAGLTPLVPGKFIRIQSDDGLARAHFTGVIESVEPQPGEHGTRAAIIHATTIDAQLAHFSARLPPLVNVRSDQVVRALLNRFPLRRAGLALLWVLEVPGMSELDLTARLAADEPAAHWLESGVSTFTYAGDLWNIPADEALRQTVESERGRFFIHRDGTATFYNRHHTLRAAAPAAVFEDDVEALDYSYGAGFANHVQVTVIPRQPGLPNSPLWTLENAQRLPPGTRRFVVSYRAADGSPMGALAVTGLSLSANTKADGTGAPVPVSAAIVEAGASAAALEVRNDSGVTAYLLPGASLLGRPLFIGTPLVVEHSDTLSITFHGCRTLALNVPLVDSADEADQMARYELRVRRLPLGVVSHIETSARTHPQAVLALALFDRIVVRESQTGHAAEYLIVGETHEVTLGGTRHQARWILEPADPTRFWQLDLSLLDETTIVTY